MVATRNRPSELRRKPFRRILPALEGWFVGHSPEIFELDHNAVHDGETREHSLLACSVDRV
jgi:hypothetical protein